MMNHINVTALIPLPTKPNTTLLHPDICEHDIQKAELPVLLIFTLVVNGVASVVLWHMRGTYDTVDHLLVSILNINDLMTTVLYTVSWLVSLPSCGRLLQPDGVCGLFGWLGSSLVLWSAFIILIMASLRCLSMAKPFYYRSHVSSRSVVRAAVGTFLFSLIVFLFPFTGQGKPFRLYTQNLICALDFAPGGYTVWHRGFVGFVGVLGVVTILFVLVCNLLIIKTLRKHTIMSRPDIITLRPVTNVNSSAVTKRRIFQRVTVAVSLVYVLCYGPFSVRLLIDTVINLDHQNDTIHSVSLSLLFLSPLLNPVIYGLFNKGFRGLLIKLMRCEKLQLVNTPLYSRTTSYST